MRSTVAIALACMMVVGCTPKQRLAQRQVPQLTAEQRARDFDHMWDFVRDRYCCFADKAVDWEHVRRVYRPEAEGAPDVRALVSVLERALDELYDPHTHLTSNLRDSWRLPAYDIWAEWQGGTALILEVRVPSAAHSAGARPGMRVTAFGGQPIAQAVESRMPKCLVRRDPAALDWALRSLLSGRRDRPRQLDVVDASGRSRSIVIHEPASQPEDPPVSFRHLEHGIGYIRISTFADPAVVDAFDSALEALRKSRALVLDVRNNHGGDTAVSRPIMGRFIHDRKQYAWMSRREGAKLGTRWPEYVERRGPWTYDGPVVVVVNHFSESVAEGIAMGLDGMGRATVVGTPMADLGAATARTTLPHSNIGVQISAEPVFHVNGAPRDAFVPRVPVDLTNATGDDPILAAAVAHLLRSLAVPETRPGS